MKIIFIGCVEIGHTMLQSIYNCNYHVDTIFTLSLNLKNKTSGFVDFEPIAKKNNSQLIRVTNINDSANIKTIKTIQPDLIIVSGWQRLICEEILSIPKLGTIGFHSSLLPKYKGRAPINWALIMGEKETGITMFYLTPDEDSGDIIAQESFPILLNDDCNTVYQKAAIAGSNLLQKYLPLLEKYSAPRRHNPAKTFPSYPKRTPKDGLIDFNRSALDIYNFIRALTSPYPGAYYFNKEKQKIIIWKASILFEHTYDKNSELILNTLDLPIKVLKYTTVTN